MDQYSWALQMVDATSKIPSGLLSFNLAEMGDFQQCVNIDARTLVIKKTTSSVHQKKSEIISLDTFDPYAALLSKRLLWALCLPDGCTTDDANRVGAFLLTSVVGNEVGVRFFDLLCQTIKEVNPPLTRGAIATIAILALLLSTVVLSTLYDM
ncbi:hypothetical protein MTP99_011717 [Tenebrio molitor]|nr:hypothetical protein MTP99_011717 [Tenebrio molitor]